MLNSPYSYIIFSKSIRLVNIKYKLSDQKQILVLEAIISAHENRSPLSILDITLMNEIASQATLHGISKKLISSKLIKVVTSEHDARRKYATPTKLGLSWLEDCSKTLDSFCSIPRQADIPKVLFSAC